LILLSATIKFEAFPAVLTELSNNRPSILSLPNGFLAGCQDETAYTVIYCEYQNIGEMRYIYLLPKQGG